MATLTQDVIKTSEIEGQMLDTQQVRSLIARRMGIEIAALPQMDRSADGIVEVMLDATRHYQKPLDQDRLFGWHAALFPTGRSGLRKITVGGWRTDTSGPMQVVSGALGREKIHYEAPPHDRLNAEMTRFLAWLNAGPATDPVLTSALAHFWFLTIHPFDDGNGRIARAIADMILARSENSAQRFYSMSAQIEVERKNYYLKLERNQRGDTDITSWIEWFLECLRRALEGAESTIGQVLRKARVWKLINETPVNDRQRSVINRLLDGFKGKLSSSKYAKLAKCSADTALRDINDLLDRKILVRESAGGRSTSYRLASRL